MQPSAIDYGTPAETYWGLTLEEIILNADSGKRRRIADLKEKVMLDHKLAQLNSYAFNDPKKMPKIQDHYSFMKELEEEKLKQVAPNDQLSVPKKSNWELHKEMMMRQSLAIKAKRARQKRSEGGG